MYSWLPILATSMVLYGKTYKKVGEKRRGKSWDSLIHLPW